MESPSTEAELREELRKKGKELSLLRAELKSSHEQKETNYKQLQLLRNSIKSCLTQIPSLKGERDQLTQKVKELKQQRDTFNTLTKEKATLKEEAHQRKKQLTAKFDANAKSNPSEIKSLIRKLEQQLETEVMPFPQEEKLRKRVKELQAQQKKMSELEEAWKISNATAADAAEVRRKAEQFHREVQGTAVLSQQKHQQINSLYDKIKELRQQEKPLEAKHQELRNQYEHLKKKIQELQSLVQGLSKFFKGKEEKSLKEQLQEKTAQVSEKIKKKEKLKMEDILAYQAGTEN